MTELQLKQLLISHPVQINGMAQIFNYIDVISLIIFPKPKSSKSSLEDSIRAEFVEYNKSLKFYVLSQLTDLIPPNTIVGYVLPEKINEYKVKIEYKFMNEALIEALSHRPKSKVLLYKYTQLPKGLRSILKEGPAVLSVAGEKTCVYTEKSHKEQKKREKEHPPPVAVNNDTPVAKFEVAEHVIMLFGHIFAEAVENIRREEAYHAEEIPQNLVWKMLGQKIKKKIDKTQVVVEDTSEEDFAKDVSNLDKYHKFDYKQPLDPEYIPTRDELAEQYIHGTAAPDMATAVGWKHDREVEHRLYSKFHNAFDKSKETNNQLKEARHKKDVKKIQDMQKGYQNHLTQLAGKYHDLKPITFVFLGYTPVIKENIIAYLESLYPANPLGWDMKYLVYTSAHSAAVTLTEEGLIEEITKPHNDYLRNFALTVLKKSRDLRRSYLLMKKHPCARRRVFMFLSDEGPLIDIEHASALILRRNGNHSLNVYSSKNAISPYAIKERESIAIPKYFIICMLPPQLAQEMFEYDIHTIIVEDCTYYDILAFALFGIHLEHLKTFNLDQIIKDLPYEAIPIIKQWLSVLKSEYLTILISTILHIDLNSPSPPLPPSPPLLTAPSK